MNAKIAFASLLAVAGLVGAATPASAGPDIRVNIGIGRPGPVIVEPVRPVVVVPAAPAYGYGYGAPVVPVYRAPDYCPPPAPRGYWKDVSVKVWVPAEWVVTRDRHGHAVRSLRPGYFTYRTDRVWVADAGRHGDYGRRG